MNNPTKKKNEKEVTKTKLAAKVLLLIGLFCVALLTVAIYLMVK
ncbi:hypothetical protein J2Y71_001225 [Bacillus pumilus]|nr:hypothetical protein [Bacillus pumilus]MDF9783984.1 hypothetical protein [Bacillus pumilus]